VILFILLFFADDENTKLRVFFLGTFFFALFFWCWALKNTVGGDFMDLGVISFGTVVVSSSYMLGVTASYGFGSTASNKLVRIATTCTHLFVAVNYLLGTYVGYVMLSRPGFGIYCIVFTLLWLGIAFFGHSLMKSAALGASSSANEHLPLSS
jgi:hypothetical protein